MIADLIGAESLGQAATICFNPGSSSSNCCAFCCAPEIPVKPPDSQVVLHEAFTLFSHKMTDRLKILVSAVRSRPWPLFQKLNGSTPEIAGDLKPRDPFARRLDRDSQMVYRQP